MSKETPSGKRVVYAGTDPKKMREHGLSKEDKAYNKALAKANRDIPQSEETLLRKRLYTEAEKTGPRLSDGSPAGLGTKALDKINKLSVSQMRAQVAKLDKQQKASSTQNTDAQAKTARLGRKGKWMEAQGGPGRAGVAKIAKAMKADGKTGWVTINGAKINLG